MKMVENSKIYFKHILNFRDFVSTLLLV